MPYRRGRRGAGPDQGLAVAQSPAGPRVHGDAHQAERFQVPEQVLAGDALGQRRLAGADRQVHLVRARELFGDLKAGVAAAHHEHRAGRHLIGPAVLGAVKLDDPAVQWLGDRRHAGDLERSSGDHHLLGCVAAVVELDQIAAVRPPDGADLAVELNRQVEALA